jgi:hypothetical protein
MIEGGAMSSIKVGQRLRSQVCDTEVIVVRAPEGDAELTCGGHPMTTDVVDAKVSPAVAGAGGGNPVGKRFTDADSGTEVLVTKAGTGLMQIAGRTLELLNPKALPSSD